MKFDKRIFKKLFKEYRLVGKNPATKLIQEFIYDTTNDKKLFYLNGVCVDCEDIRILLCDVGCGYRKLKSVTAKRDSNFYKLFVRTYE